MIGGEDVDIYYKLRKIGRVTRVDTIVFHDHIGYRTNKSLEKIKQNGNINGALFRIYGVEYTRWWRALLWCIRYPKDYGYQFWRGFKNKKQDYRRCKEVIKNE